MVRTPTAGWMPHPVAGLPSIAIAEVQSFWSKSAVPRENFSFTGCAAPGSKSCASISLR
jgi:hypothetical protein